MKKEYIVGIDEVGRGALAASVTAAAVTVRQFSIFSRWKLDSKKIKDSKRLTPRKREEIFRILKNHPGVEWGIGYVSERVIDRINILQATKLAMLRAVRNLKLKMKKEKLKIGFLMIDGNFGIDLDIPQKSIIKGDEKVFLIKLASIVVKVTRDRAMLRYHKKFPQYGFDKHKGYGTKLHMAILKKCGPCRLHRRTFSPMRNCCKI